MNSNVFRFAPGVRLRNDAPERPVLLVPEGVVDLSDSASAALALLDGKRSPHEIATLLAKIYDAPESELESDVYDLCASLHERGFLIV